MYKRLTEQLYRFISHTYTPIEIGASGVSKKSGSRPDPSIPQVQPYHLGPSSLPFQRTGAGGNPHPHGWSFHPIGFDL